MTDDRLYYVKVEYNNREIIATYAARNMTHARTLALGDFQAQDENAKIVYCLPARNGM